MKRLDVSAEWLAANTISCAQVPSLARRGAPVYDLCVERVVTVVSDAPEGKPPFVIVGPINGKLVKRKIAFLYLDLTHPLGQAVMVSWLRTQGQMVGGEVSTRELLRMAHTILRSRSAVQA